MNLRFCLLSSTVVATATLMAIGCNQREPLAPYAFLGGDCANLPPGNVGASYSFQFEVTGGSGPYTYSADGLPDGLDIDPETGEINGVPEEEGTFQIVITVEDGTGFAQQIACGELVIGPANLLNFDCDANSPPLAVQGVTYSHTFVVDGGEAPYTWQATGLPADLTIDDSGTISGVPNVEPNTFPVEVIVTDSSDPSLTATCNWDFEVRPGLQVNKNAMEAIGNCVDVGSGLDIDQMVADGIIIGGDGTPITCAFDAFEPPDIGFRGNGNLPPGITVDERCVATGTVPQAEPLGVYAFAVTLTQEGSQQRVWLPYCATQEVQHPGAYDIGVNVNGGDDWMFEPGVTTMTANSQVTYGANNDPQVRVLRNCSNNSCFYKYYFGYNALNGGVSGEQSAALPGPMMTVDGMTHSIRVDDNLGGAGLDGRYWVVNVRWDYCLFGSDAPNAPDLNDDACGTKELAQANGDDSNLMWSLVVVPN